MFFSAFTAVSPKAHISAGRGDAEADLVTTHCGDEGQGQQGHAVELIWSQVLQPNGDLGDAEAG